MKKRMIGAIVIVLICVPFLIIGGIPFRIASGILGAFSLKELMDLKEHHKKIPSFIFILSIVCFSLLVFFGLNTQIITLDLNEKLLALTLISLLVPCLFYKEENYKTQDALYAFGIILFIAIFTKSLIFLRIANMYIVWYLILIAVLTDTFAYVIGSLVGRHKCSPTISPNKTWEGSIGGVIMGAGLSIIFYILKIGNKNIISIIILSIILSVVGQLGDLFFSKMKRENHIKDFSNLIPGHGGLLDRIDSLVFIILTYIVLVEII